MSYTVLARRYRSRDFDELIGQEPIARTLQNAIASDRTAHAYLFCGTRGVGKTSMARIFAAAINVTEELAEADHIRDAIFRGDDLDVIEIDGASNRGVQEARDLIASAGLTPARCRHKIYIIDEVHMLTREAFNALLKTMEEPPGHVKFILCTTDPQKVPATIQSRCQRFDFRPISTQVIAGQLGRVLAEEGIEAEDALLVQVARLGNGSMRDALSLLDRLIAGGERSLTLSGAEQLLGLPDHALAEKLIAAVADADAAAALKAGDEILANGATVEQALEMIADYLRTLLVILACGRETDLLEIAPESVESAAELAGRFDLPAVIHMIAVCDSVARNSRGSTAARALYDAAIARLCMSEQLADVTALLAGGSFGQSGSTPAGRKKKREVADPRNAAPAMSSAPALALAPAPTVVEVKASAPSQPPAGEDLWSRAVAFAANSPRDAARAEDLDYVDFDGRTLKLAVKPAAASRAKSRSEQTDETADLVHRATGFKPRVVIAVPVQAEPAQPAPSPERVEEALRLPAVRKAAELFDATVIDVQDALDAEPDTTSEEHQDV